MGDRRSPDRSQRGSVLVLVPTLALVAVALCGIAVDLVAVHAAQRRTQTLLASAADDAAAMIDTRRIQLDGATVVDAAAARRVVSAHVGAARLPGRLRRLDVEVRRDSVEVRADLAVGRIVLRALPGSSAETTVTVRARAVVTG